MAYTFSTVKTKLQEQIGDPSLSTSLMADAINYTEQQIFNTFELTLNSAYQSNSVTAGTNVLASTLPTDLQKITSLVVTAPTGQEGDITDYFVSVKDFRAKWPVVTTSNPLAYWTYFTSIEFSSLATADTTLRIDYVKSVPLLSGDSDVPTIPQSFEELLLLGAKIRIYEQKEDFDYAGQFQQRYADLLEQFVSRYSTRQVDQQFVIPGPRATQYRTR